MQYDLYRKPGSIRLGGEWDWNKFAPNGGAIAGSQEIIKIPVGVMLDRFGATNGTYLSPRDTSYGSRSLPPGSAAGPYNQYEVIKPFSVERAQIAPAFEQPGLGIQYRIPEVSGKRVTVQDLIDNGYIGVKK